MVSTQNESGAVDAADGDTAVEDRFSLFHDDGFVILPNLLPSEILQEWQFFAQKGQNGDDIVTWIFRTLHARGHTAFPQEKQEGQYALGHGVKNGFCEIVSRSPGRYEISLLNLQKHANDNIVMPPSLDHLLAILEQANIHSLLSQSTWKEKVRVVNLSLIISTPDAATQGWHADGGHVNLQEHLPCHVLNVFIPLQDMTADLGPTQLRPGTHVHTRNLGPMMLAAKCRKTLRPPVTPLLKAGDALCFDYRILHRGLANVSSNNSRRAMLCITVAQEWYNDLLNFPKRSLFTTPQTNQPGGTKDINNLATSTAGAKSEGSGKAESVPPGHAEPVPKAMSSLTLSADSEPATDVDSNKDKSPPVTKRGRLKKTGGLILPSSPGTGPGPFDEAPCIYFLQDKQDVNPILQKHQTPQYVATLQPQTGNIATAERPSEDSYQSLAPIITASIEDGGHQFLVQPLGNGRVALWNTKRIMKTWRNCEVKQQVFNNLLKADLIMDAKQQKGDEWLEFVQISPSFFKGKEKSQNGYLLGLLSTGTVVLFCFSVDLPISGGNNDDSKPSPESLYKVLTTWHMGDGGVTCLGVTESGLVLVGDEKGMLFASRLQQKARSSFEVSPIWKGSFDHGYSIQSVLQLPIQNNANQSKTKTTDSSSASLDECVAITLQPPSCVATSMQLEVVNVSSISMIVESSSRKSAEMVTNRFDRLRLGKAKNEDKTPTSDGRAGLRLGKAKKEDKTPTSDGRTGDEVLSLEDFWVLPEAGGEVVDANVIRERGSSTVPSLSIRTIHWIPSQGVHSLERLPGQNRVVVTLSDGTGAILSVNKHEDGRLFWQIEDSNKHQWLFSYPNIGMGCIHLSSDGAGESLQQLHLACALRGGTVYLIPVSEQDESNIGRTVKVIMYPHDIESDTSRQSLQSFTAANISAVGGDLDVDEVPILFFAWPGGIIDLYSCHLLNYSTVKESAVKSVSESPLTEAKVMEEVVSNGAANDLRRILDQYSSFLFAAEPSKDGFPSALDLKLWRDAAREISRLPNEQINSCQEIQDSSAFKSLLLQVCDPSYDFDQFSGYLRKLASSPKS